MAAPLPSNITIVEAEADGKTIRDLAVSVNVAYLTPYYQVKRKENISVVKDVIAVTDTAFYQGADARNFLGISTTTKVVLKPSDIPAGCEVFVQTTSHNRKIPVGTKCLLQTAASADVAVAAPVPVAASAPVPPATLNRSRPTTYSGLTAPDAKRPRLSAEEEQDDDGDELGSKVLSLRLNREGARSCEALQCSLIWNDIADLDLSCVTPDGETIYYGNKETECGGWLDVDMNVNKDTASLEPVENIFWASAPSGKYVFKVTNFNCHSGPQRSVFTNADRSVPYRVFLTKNGKKELFDGSVGHKQVQTCFEFELEGDGALGSYVVMPPSDVKTTFKEACEKHGVTYTQGSGYYALARKENISHALAAH